MTKAERLDCIHRARVWEPTDVASKDLYEGPPGKLPFHVDQEVACDFVPRPLSGRTEKFLCRLEDGTVVKVKYQDEGKYKEVFGEVLGTRLFWALGFYSDRLLPVRVVCRGCPEQPWEIVDEHKRHHLDTEGNIAPLPSEARIGTYRFELATIEEPIDARAIEVGEHAGWSWREIDRIEPGAGGSSRAEVDALKLLNAFTQNADNKAKQNELACPREAVREEAGGKVACLRPIMYVDDLGSVFGRGGFTTGYDGRVDYLSWGERPVWKSETSCKTRLVSIGGPWRPSTLKDPVVGEEGRALLAGLLGRLSDAQIAGLFRAARIEKLHQRILEDGVERDVTVDDWVRVFKRKRDEIAEHRCAPAS